MQQGNDAFGQHLLAQFHSKTPGAELIERDDNYIDTGSDAGLYFSEHQDWPAAEQKLLESVRGRVLDVGCGAGRHSLYLQDQGCEVTAIDSSPGAIEVCRLRGVRDARAMRIEDIDRFGDESFDVILMLGNNFGLFGDAERAPRILAEMSRITSPGACIIAGSRNPYATDSPDHLDYHELNRGRGRMAGQIRMRVRYYRLVGEWFDYLLVSPEEMRGILAGTVWQIEDLADSGDANYFAVITKKR